MRMERATVALIRDGTPLRQFFKVTRRPGDRVLIRRCGSRFHDPLNRILEVHSGAPFFTVAWIGEATLGMDETMAAAASLFGRYVVIGPGLAP
ncbi:MAG: hypothetical protein ICV73_30730 [Acetobacteraceae bacterium]|nr:hypothetical protein [Acetobacteraceae bacterium]